MSKTKSNDSHCSLYGFIKDHNIDLFNILDDMCAVGLFRPRHPVTFLNPNEKLTQELVKMVDNGESEDAFKILQSLFIFGKHDKLDDKMVSYNRKSYETDISGLKKDKSFVQWKSKDNTSVFIYDLPKFPKEGKSTQPPKLERPKRNIDGGNEGDEKKVTVTNELFEDLDNTDNKLMIKVARYLNSLMEHIEESDSSLFKKLSLLMDPNMIVSWFILVQPSSEHLPSHPHISSELFESWKRNDLNTKGVTTIHKIFDSNNNNNNEEVKNQSELRNGINKEGCVQTKEAIENAYKGNFEKLLEDELRFRFSDDDGDNFTSFNINELKNIKWDTPKESLVLIKEPPSACLFRSELHKTMLKFIESSSFKYTLYNAKIHERIKETISGAGHGNNNVKKMIKILGNKNRDFIKNMEKTDANKTLSKFVSSLTSKQVSSLKQLLAGFD